MVIGKRIPKKDPAKRRQFFSYEVEWGGANNNAPRVGYIHFTDLDKDKQRTYIFEFSSKPTVTTIYRLINEIVAILNAELDCGVFEVKERPAPTPEYSDYRRAYIDRKAEKRKAKQQQGSLIGKNDRSGKGIPNELTGTSRRIEDLGFNI